MRNQLFALLFLLRTILDKRFAAKLRFALVQVHIMIEKYGAQRIIVSPEQRQWLLSIGAEVDHDIMDALGIVTPQTYRRWLRLQRKGKLPKAVGRKRFIPQIVRNLVLRFTLENPTWGKRRISAELNKLAIRICPNSVRGILRQEGFTPPPDKTKRPAQVVPWQVFLKAHMDSVVSCDFFSKTLWTIRGKFDAYCLAFIHLGTRRVWCSPTTLHPNEAWVMQQARNVAMWMQDLGIELRFLIRDNDTKFTKKFDHFFNSIVKERSGRVIKTIIKAPKMNAFAEAFIGTLKRECLAMFICVRLSQIDRIIQTYLKFYNRCRPHQGKDIGNKVLDPNFHPIEHGDIKCEKFLGGLLKSYYRRAA